MTYNRKYVLILILIIIAKGEPFNNSYRLIRMMEWRFKIVEPLLEIFTDIRNSGYVEYELKKGVYFYRLAEKGVNLVKSDYNNCLEFLSYNYPDEIELLKILFENFRIKENLPPQ